MICTFDFAYRQVMKCFMRRGTERIQLRLSLVEFSSPLSRNLRRRIRWFCRKHGPDLPPSSEDSLPFAVVVGG
ncbi:hypothetical protein JHK85_005346 [Glycine max]|nr:hypothetical protein JHK85_005346 [Glycine max]